MRALSIAVAVLAYAAIAVSAHVGTDQDGNKFFSYEFDDYMMCGKCAFGGDYNPNVTQPWYKLVCDSAATNSSLWGTLHYECNRGCSTCSKTSAITIGKELDAVYKAGLYSSSGYKRVMIPASVQCCPQVVQHDSFPDTTCSGTPTKTEFGPAGCSGYYSTGYSHVTCAMNDGGGLDSLLISCNSSTYLKNGDTCPTSRECQSDLSYHGAGRNADICHLKIKFHCLMDGTQQCLRLVMNDRYMASMTTGTDDISGLSCLASNTGATPAPAPPTPVPDWAPGTHVGIDMDGNKFSVADYTEYMMCGKCTYGGALSGNKEDATKNWYKLVCDSAATNSSLWGTLHYECNSGCGTCGKTSTITVGKELDAVYKAGLGSYGPESLMIPASVQCCPQVVQMDKFADTTCGGSPTETRFNPAGCNYPSNLASEYNSEMCASNGSAPSSFRMVCDSSTSPLKAGDTCPTSHSDCLLETTEMTNSPCLTIPADTTYNGTVVNLAGITDTRTCLIDGTQQCLLLVHSSVYMGNMSGGSDDISGLPCGRSGASVVSFAVAVVAAIVAILV